MEDEGRRLNKFRNGADVVVGRQRPEAAQGADIRVEDPRRRRGQAKGGGREAHETARPLEKGDERGRRGAQGTEGELRL